MDRDSFCVTLVLVCLAAAPVARTAAVLGPAGNESSNATHHVGHAGVPWETCDFETEHHPYIWLVLYIYLTLVLFVGKPQGACMHCEARRNTFAPQLPSPSHYVCVHVPHLVTAVLAVLLVGATRPGNTGHPLTCPSPSPPPHTMS